jgi:hypothetical protein
MHKGGSMSANPKGRPRKGRRVSFTRTDGLTPERRADAVAGLRFTIGTAHGGSALIDLVALRPRRLALTFGSALRELAPTVVRSTVIQHVNGLKRFFQFLNETSGSVDGPENLRAEHIDSFESWLEAQGVTTIHRHTIVAKAVIALRTIDASRPDRLNFDVPGHRTRLPPASIRQLFNRTRRFLEFVADRHGTCHLQSVDQASPGRTRRCRCRRRLRARRRPLPRQASLPALPVRL